MDSYSLLYAAISSSPFFIAQVGVPSPSGSLLYSSSIGPSLSPYADLKSDSSWLNPASISDAICWNSVCSWFISIISFCILMISSGVIFWYRIAISIFSASVILLAFASTACLLFSSFSLISDLSWRTFCPKSSFSV